MKCLHRVAADEHMTSEESVPHQAGSEFTRVVQNRAAKNRVKTQNNAKVKPSYNAGGMLQGTVGCICIRVIAAMQPYHHLPFTTENQANFSTPFLYS